MPGVTGLSTTFLYPNFTGPLTLISPTDTRFLSLIGGLTGGGGFTESTMFGWQEEDLRAAAQNVALEGADAPTAQARDRTLAKNVVQIIHETVETSYTRQAATQQVADIVSAHPNIEGWGGRNPVESEQDHQIMLTILQIARDTNWSFLRGVFQEPANNSSARQTRGMINVPTTNVTTGEEAAEFNVTGETSDDLVDATAHGLANGEPVSFSALVGGSSLEIGRIYYVVTTQTNTFQLALTVGGAPLDFGSDITATSTIQQLGALTEAMILDGIQGVWDNGGMMEQDTALLIVNSKLARALTTIFITDKNYREMSRNVAGVAVKTIETDFGLLSVLLDRHMAEDKVLFVSAEQCEPIYLLHPEKGFLFEEELAKTGATERTQIYGEIGLRFGNQLSHGVLNDVSRL